MDARIRALLEPRARAKGGKSSPSTKEQGSPAKPTQSRQGATNGSLPSTTSIAANRPVPVYDPKKLLDPRGARKATNSSKPNPYLKTLNTDSDTSLQMPPLKFGSRTPQLHRENSASRSMIEDLYGVERRAERPVKRAKLDSDQDEDKTKSKGGSRMHHSSGIVGEYMRPGTDDPDQTTDHGKIVDLTNDDDVDGSDDDIKVIKARSVTNEQVVCFGRMSTTVHAHAIPMPRKMLDLYGDTGLAPITKCTAVRVPSKNTIIDVKDPHDFVFGRIEADIANVLAPLIDGLKRFRLEIWLNPRKKKPKEAPHQPCSEHMVVNINLYGRRADVERVGRILGQRNIWLKTPNMVEKNHETVNPHVDRFKNVVPQARSSGRTNVYSESRTVEEATEAVTKLFDHYANTARPLLETEVRSIIVTPLLPHQKQALTFMLERERPRTYGETESDNSSLWRKKRKGNGLVYYEETVTGITLKEEPDQVFGGLLADVMGLGKTIEALALIAATKEEADEYGSQKLIRADLGDSILLSQSKATLIIAPVSTVKNWEDQISEHTEPGALSAYVYHGPHREKNPYKLAQYDIVISTYSTVAAECSTKAQGTSPIRAIRWFRLILDEAHTIRESRASQSQAMYSLSAQRRWCLTGTPIQNRLDDLGSLTRFLRLYPYDTTMRFNQYVRSPAQSGDDNYLKALRVFVDSFTLRRLKDRIDLPDRKDLKEWLEFSVDERRLHDFFKDRASVQIKLLADETEQRTVSQHHVLRAIMTLRLICNHGRELLKENDLESFKGNSQYDAIDIDAETSNHPARITPRSAYEALSLLAEAELDMCKHCDRKISGDSPRAEADITEDVRGYMLPCIDLVCYECFQHHKDTFDNMSEQSLECPFCQLEVAAQYVAIPRATAELLDSAPEETPNGTSEAYKKGMYTGPSTKVKALLDDLHEIAGESEVLEAKGEPPLKSVVFSEFTSNLDLIERGLDKNGFKGRYMRIDGSMSLNKRKVVLDRLNNDDNVVILLASIKAAGQGLNLTAASRAFIMEPMWNPAAESQAVDRIYRIGQHREVVVKRYLINDSIEGKIIELQKKKQALADISLNKNHNLLNKKESREKHMKEILSLFK